MALYQYDYKLNIKILKNIIELLFIITYLINFLLSLVGYYVILIKFTAIIIIENFILNIFYN